MRILHVLDHSIPLQSGYTFRTRSILAEQRRRGWQTHHVTSPKQMGFEDGVDVADGYEFHRTSAQGLQGKPALWREWALMQRLQRRIEAVAQEVEPHIIHAHSPVLNARAALLAGKRLGVPVVYEVRAFWEDAAVDHGTTREGSARYRLTRRFETWALQRASHVFTICEGLRSDMIERGVSSSKITVIPNAVDIHAFDVGREPDAALRARVGLHGADVVGFIGSFYAYEGLDLLVHAMPLILAKRPNTRALLVGGGPQESALKSMVQSMGLQDRVTFVGRVPHDEVQRYYDLVDVLVYPRHRMRLTDLVTPLKPLEAMAQGRLLVASDVGGHQELIQDGMNGRLFAAGSAEALVDAVDHVLSHRDAWPAWRLAARQFVERERNWQGSVARYAEPYGRLVGAQR